MNLAIIGATGVVGKEVLSILEERNLPIESLYLYASQKSRGKKILFQGSSLIVEELSADVFDRNIDFAIFSAGKTRSLEFAPIAASKGVVVIDNSSAFRMQKDVPLIVPEVNLDDLKHYKSRNIIANPNCSTIQLVMALKPLQKYGIKRVVVSTYQAVSGAGSRAIDELKEQTLSLLQNKSLNKEVFPHQMAFNCLPHIDDFLENNYSFEEEKVIQETRKILQDPDLKITCTAVRVPVISSHAESVNVEFENKIDLAQVRSDLDAFPGVKVLDNPQGQVYPLNSEATHKDEVFVGRLRYDFSIISLIFIKPRT